MSTQLAIWKRALERFGSNNPAFSSPAELGSAASDYFAWATRSPLQAQKLFHYQGRVTTASEDVMRAFTLRGLCTYCGISKATWDKYRAKEEFAGICEMIEEIIYTQKFEGAAGNLLNANIIARDLGLADRQDLSSADGSMTPRAALDFRSMSSDALGELLSVLDAQQGAGVADE